jgi:hypothetical protein
MRMLVVILAALAGLAGLPGCVLTSLAFGAIDGAGRESVVGGPEVAWIGPPAANGSRALFVRFSTSWTEEPPQAIFVIGCNLPRRHEPVSAVAEYRIPAGGAAGDELPFLSLREIYESGYEPPAEALPVTIAAAPGEPRALQDLGFGPDGSLAGGACDLLVGGRPCRLAFSRGGYHAVRTAAKVAVAPATGVVDVALFPAYAAGFGIFLLVLDAQHW